MNSHAHRSRQLRRLSRGFTLQEMLVSLAIGGTLATGGIGTWTLVQENALTAAANDIVMHLALARSEAIKRHTPVKVCPSEDQRNCTGAANDYTYWQAGWLVYADGNKNGKPEPGEIIRVQSHVSGNFAIRTSKARRTITYQPLGMSGGSTITFALCGAESARYVTVSNTGRARVSRNSTSSVRCG